MIGRVSCGKVSLPDEQKDKSARKLVDQYENGKGITDEHIALQGLAMCLFTGSDIRDELHTNRFIFAQLPEIMVTAVSSN